MNIGSKMRSAAAALAILIGTSGAAYSQSIFDQLAGPGEKVELWTEAPAGGGEHFLRFLNNADGSIDRFIGKGRVILRSPKLNLEADDLL
ncbi:hypothetical protein RZS08_03015, partial [Arthrospira platensis SPKY1]|nr:hypothetical protein [Arthrospira platensis SPKY1]